MLAVYDMAVYSIYLQLPSNHIHYGCEKVGNFGARKKTSCFVS
jgi:hypothetical protein